MNQNSDENQESVENENSSGAGILAMFIAAFLIIFMILLIGVGIHDVWVMH